MLVWGTAFEFPTIPNDFISLKLIPNLSLIAPIIQRQKNTNKMNANFIYIKLELTVIIRKSHSYEIRLQLYTSEYLNPFGTGRLAYF